MIAYTVMLACPLILLTAWQQPTFRASTAVVSVTVSVQRGNRPVLGLRLDDFEVYDDGQPQTLTSMAVEDVPLDITLLLDSSSSVAAVSAQLVANARKIAEGLRPIDRIRVRAFDRYIRENATFNTGPISTVRTADPTGTSLYDAIVASLIVMPVLDRRQMVVALTDGRDTQSFLSGSSMLEVCRRSESVLFMLIARDPPSLRSPSSFHPGTPFYDFEPALLREGARITGGDLKEGIFGTDAISAIRKAIDEFRASYVLRFSPVQVDRKGWHELAVTVKGNRRYTVRARRGYAN